MNKYLIKIDISGIQGFIFNVPSKGAARNLKGRSFFVQILTEIANIYFAETAGNMEVVYNGGGNLLFYANYTREKLEAAILCFQNCFQRQQIFPFIAFIEVVDSYSFDEQLKKIASELNIKHLKRPVSFEIVEPIKASEFDDIFKNFTQNMAKAIGYSIEKNNGIQFRITDNSFDIAEYSLILQYDTKPQYPFGDTVINSMPQADGNILEFDKIAEIAKARNVDDKLAALKLDIDNLGILFRNKSKEEFQTLSRSLQDFFSRTIYLEILRPLVISGDIYPVFSGGDDCFLIGTWDKTIDAAIQIWQHFNFVQPELRRKIGLNEEITVSAGIVVCNPKFPLLRIADTVENALALAKEHGKNRVCIFGEVLQWPELENARGLAKILKKLIDDGEPKALLHRIRSSEIGFRSLQDRAVNKGKIDFPQVYRLKYFLRNARKSENREILETEFNKYADALLNDFINQEKASSAAQFPVAARLAELLLKSSNQ